jgi:predicted metal-binding membrane protein
VSAAGSPLTAADGIIGQRGVAQVFGAARARLGLVALLFGLAAVAWWSTADRMAGMDEGPGTDLGALGWFLGVWVVMMAAMMFPSVAPTVALYARMARRRAPTGPLLFTAGYVVTWTAAGLVAYGLLDLGRALLGDQLAWDNAGRWVAGGTLVLAAVYELTPFKDVCLGKCRSPLGFMIGAWREGLRGAVEMGARHGAWCVGCCWALMASLFALGVMSLAWMALVAALIALEKTVPWGRPSTYATALVLLALGVVLIASPEVLPGLVVPSDGGAMDGMSEGPAAMPTP